MDKINVEHMLAIEEPFMKVPLEQLKREVRQSQKLAEREMQQAHLALAGLAKKQNSMDSADYTEALNGLISRLVALKQKLEEAKHKEAQLIQRSKQRATDLNELNDFTSTTQPEFQRWSRTRLERVLIDYMLRSGNVNTAKLLMEKGNLEHFADSSLFALVMSTERELREDHSCHGALSWCADNRSALRKIQSSLEFDLRLQEFIEMIRAKQNPEAIAYAKKHLTSWSDTQLPRIQRAMTLLAFPPTTTCPPYRHMFDVTRWSDLAHEFRQVIFQLFNLPSQPLLYLLLQTGLSALKTPACKSEDPGEHNRNCPVCQTDTLGKLAQSLPLSHHSNSNLVCRITGEKMNEDNPPMRLPNGYVYSLNSLTEMSRKLGGKVKCPRSGETYYLADAKKLFIS
ncbi:GID complex subunit containing RING finger motif [Coemansia thaxteri]|uniref:GID complex subunit containing RING finger motif n=1 Tax=Coemansia thaxteri TaxID=2663907 RepID=A0A9W8BM59_9FUNG|nr:GID complex subunit containing RING finger motif [Coemansia thaxteri]KAJ2006284.1 GID complex subunit containing RING finger motif [Coemansia thaxteri]KAJ2464902.1 GID complex subunit containing RING finger motif [Coemansia sp. RSA 2322]KAJ2487997.1 GID complex subunit containing RING finger motif [Coemansia sp. RSA 2320]